MDLRTYIESRGFEQKEFAKLLDISDLSLRNYMDGKRLMPLDIVAKVEEITKNKVAMKDILKKWREKHG